MSYTPETPGHLGGQWGKTSRAVRTGYLFTDLTEANAEETIRFAKLGGFEYIMTYDSTWSSSLGSYPINTKNFPGGEASLKATVDKCHAAGLKVGLHFLTSFVGKNDPVVRPRPDPRLLKDDQGTRAAVHQAGTKIHHLVERYGCYLADLRTTLKGEISERIAGVEALAELDVRLRRPEVVMGDKTLALATDLRMGDYAEVSADGSVRVFDRQGTLLSSFQPTGKLPVWQAGVNPIALRGADPACVKFTAITVGTAVSW